MFAFLVFFVWIYPLVYEKNNLLRLFGSCNAKTKNACFVTIRRHNIRVEGRSAVCQAR